MPRGVYPRPTLLERVQRKIVRGNGCHLWRGATDGRDYPVVWLDGVNIRALAVLWRAERGEIPFGMELCHRCDTPRCMNLDHVFTGTHADNLRDMWAKERSPRGEQRVQAVLTNQAVREMRLIRMRDGMSYQALASQFGVSINAAWCAVNHKSWRHLS
jgi:hypothetical protein